MSDVVLNIQNFTKKFHKDLKSSHWLLCLKNSERERNKTNRVVLFISKPNDAFRTLDIIFYQSRIFGLISNITKQFHSILGRSRTKYICVQKSI